jgi:hypothetical protein
MENYRLVVQTGVSGPNLGEMFTAARSSQHQHGCADQKNVTFFAEMPVVMAQRLR